MCNIYDDFEEFGDDAVIGDGAKIGNWARIGDNVVIKNNVKIGDNVRIGHNAKIGYNVEIADNAKIGDNVRIAGYAKIGDRAEIGCNVELGDGVELGDFLKIGDKFRCEGMEVVDLFTLSNVDGTGRRVNVYVHTEGIAVIAGCFKGSLDEFCDKAKEEGKYLYSVTVRAAAEAFASEVRRQGKTGGWDK